MKTSIDTWLKIQGLKQYKPRKPILYWAAYFGGVEVDANYSIAILRHKYRNEPSVIFKAVR